MIRLEKFWLFCVCFWLFNQYIQYRLHHQNRIHEIASNQSNFQELKNLQKLLKEIESHLYGSDQ